MIRRLRPRSLRWQLILASLAVEAVLVLALTWNGFRLVEDGLAEQVEIRLKETSVLLNASLGPLMASQDYGPIADLFRESRSQEGIAYFVLTDSRGRVVLSDGWDLSRPLPPPRAFADTAHLGERFDTRMPITLSGQTYGQLALGISTRFIAQAQGRLVRESLAIAAVTLVLSGLLLTLVAFWLTRHLKRLENASAAVSAGHFDIDLPTGSQDEIGRVATAFKRMAAEIKGQFEALQSSEERFRNLLSLSTDWYWEQDADFRFTIHQPGRLGDPEGIRLSNYLLGKRTTLYPQLSLPLATAAFSLTPKIGIHSTQYALDQLQRPGQGVADQFPQIALAGNEADQRDGPIGISGFDQLGQLRSLV